MFISHSPEETFAVAARCARNAAAGKVYALTGDLGSGKTHFAKGFVAGIGSTAEVSSPTFTLVHEYGGGRLPVYHFDFYRLETADAVLRLGFDDYLDAGGICLIEWADRFRALLPPETVWISMTVLDENERVIAGLNENPRA